MTGSLKTPVALNSGSSPIFSHKTKFHLYTAGYSIKIGLLSILWLVIAYKVSVYLSTAIWFCMLLLIYLDRRHSVKKFFGTSDVETIQSESIRIRRMANQAEIERERAAAELRHVREQKMRCEEAYQMEIERLKQEYTSVERLKQQAQYELERAQRQREIAEELKRETILRNEEARQSRTWNKALVSNDMEKIQEHYLKAEENKKQTETELRKAIEQRKKAEEVVRKVTEEYEKIKLSHKGRPDNPYEVLGVHTSDNMETIREVYKKLIQIYHPDRHANLNVSSQRQKNDRMALINSSFDAISRQKAG